MSTNHGHSGTIIGTVGGTLLSISGSVHSGDVFKTIVLGILGAVTSFTCSYLLKLGLTWARSKLKKDNPNP